MCSLQILWLLVRFSVVHTSIGAHSLRCPPVNSLPQLVCGFSLTFSFQRKKKLSLSQSLTFSLSISLTSAQRRCHPEEALYLPTFSHIFVCQNLSLSLSLSLSMSHLKNNRKTKFWIFFQKKLLFNFTFQKQFVFFSCNKCMLTSTPSSFSPWR